MLGSLANPATEKGSLPRCKTDKPGGAGSRDTASTPPLKISPAVSGRQPSQGRVPRSVTVGLSANRMFRAPLVGLLGPHLWSPPPQSCHSNQPPLWHQLNLLVSFKITSPRASFDNLLKQLLPAVAFHVDGTPWPAEGGLCNVTHREIIYIFIYRPPESFPTLQILYTKRSKVPTLAADAGKGGWCRGLFPPRSRWA